MNKKKFDKVIISYKRKFFDLREKEKIMIEKREEETVGQTDGQTVRDKKVSENNKELNRLLQLHVRATFQLPASKL